LRATSDSSHRLEFGEILAIDDDGRARVRVAGGADVAVARSALGEAARVGDGNQDLVGASVLVLLENDDPALPIIVGVVRERVRPDPQVAQVELDLGANRDVLVDGRRVVLDAQQEIVLRCGKSTIVLQRDGKVLVRGAHVVSRSSGPNKIKGSSISLN